METDDIIRTGKMWRGGILKSDMLTTVNRNQSER